MATRDAQSLEAMHELLKLRTAARVRELYYDLFSAYKNLEIIAEKRQLLIRIEEITLLRYAAGKAMQQDVMMAQTEKYMLLEKEEMLRQKILSLEAMLLAVIGRTGGAPLPRPAEPEYRVFEPDLQKTIEMAVQRSPEIQSRSRMIEAAEAKLNIARKEYYPDVAISGSYYNRSGDFKDMWAATATFNIPLFFSTKQKPAEMEAKANIDLAKRETDAVRLMIEATVRDNFSMLRSSERLIDIYAKGLLSKGRQDIEQALAAYSTGRLEAVSVISRVKTLLDYESQYWILRMEREKALARLSAVASGLEVQGVKK
jgi:outer membrane protein TolC